MTVNFNTISFKGYVPVKFYLKDSNDDSYSCIFDAKTIKSLNNKLVRNLNKGSENKDKKFSNYYASYDNDYRKNPTVRTVYDYPNVYHVTGDDAKQIEGFAKQFVIAKSNSRDTLQEARNYFQRAKKYINNSCSRTKDLNGNDLILYSYFETKYNKKGEFKGYTFKGAEFVKEDAPLFIDKPNLEMAPQKTI